MTPVSIPGKLMPRQVESLLFPGSSSRNSTISTSSRRSSCARPPDGGRGSSLAPASAGAHRWRVWAIVSVGVFMASLDLFIVNIAFPDIQRRFRRHESRRAVLGAERLRDRVRRAARAGGPDLRPLGRKRGFLGGLALFAAASALCAAAPSAERAGRPRASCRRRAPPSWCRRRSGCCCRSSRPSSARPRSARGRPSAACRPPPARRRGPAGRGRAGAGSSW